MKNRKNVSFYAKIDFFYFLFFIVVVVVAAAQADVNALKSI